METPQGRSAGATLEERIRVLEDLEAIRKMKAEYVLACDERRWDDAMRYFTADAAVAFGPFGRFESAAELERFFKEKMPVTIAFTIHRLCNPIIEVHADRAKGIWYCEIPSTHIPTNKAILQQGTYYDEYVKEGNEWKHAKLDLVYSYITEFGEGWVKKNMVAV
ncbi:MAG: nuclear transport factor 2 family protein [Burkholderiales bacterium]